jgi:hypothetical protein
MRKSTLVLSFISVVTGTLAIWLWQQRQGQGPVHLDAKTPAAARDCHDVRAAVTEPLPTSTAVAATKPMTAMQAMNAATLPLPPGFVPPTDLRLLKDPEFRGALRTQNRVMFEQDLRDLPKVLGLSAEQSERLFDLLAEQRVRLLEVQSKLETGKSPMSNFQDTRARNHQELADFLGPSNMIRYEEFRTSLQSRAEVDSVRTELARGAEPLREDQVEPFIAVVSTELQRLDQEVHDAAPPDPMRPDPVAEAKRVELTVAANQRIADAARPILSGPQLAGLLDLYRRQRLQMESAGTLNRLRLEAAASAPPGAPPR